MTRLLAILALIAAGASGGVLVHRELTAGPPVVLPAPAATQVSAAGTPLLPGGWSSSSTLSFGVRARSVASSGLDVEVRPLGTRFSGAPTASSPAGVAQKCASRTTCGAQTADPTMQVRVPDGAYHWQIRLHSQRGVSPWVVSPQVVRVDTQPPAAPHVSSPTDPNPHTTYHSSTLGFQWSATDAGSGVAGYSYRLDTDPHGQARPELRTTGTSVQLAGLDTGTYYFHVRAMDRAQNWGVGATFPVRIDVTPPGLAHVRFSDFQFDPQYTSLRISFAVTHAATSVHVGVYQQSDGQKMRLYDLTNLAPGRATAVSWDGKDARGRLVAPGNYEIYVRATDRFGHSSLTGWRDFLVDYRRIVVSLSQQKLFAYDGSRLLFTSLVTTGNRALPTPPGTYHIMARFHPFTFKSPWPKSSPFYYPPSKVQYALLFREGGYFIHDAPWRSVFGPGSNASIGTPGSNYTGTHGCVNTPPDVAQRLYNWAQIGTVVVVTR